MQSVSQGFVQLRPGIREFLEKAKYNKKKLAISTRQVMISKH